MVAVNADRPSLTHPTTGPPLKLLRTGMPDHDPGVQGEVRRYAGGQRRVAVLEGADWSGSMPVWTDAAGLAQLEAWCGELLLYRDGLGVKRWCVLLRCPWTPTEDGRHRIVQLDLESVTYEPL